MTQAAKIVKQLTSAELTTLIRAGEFGAVAEPVLRAIEDSEFTGADFLIDSFVQDAFDEDTVAKFGIKPLHLQTLARVRDELIRKDREQRPALVKQDQTHHAPFANDVCPHCHDSLATHKQVIACDQCKKSWGYPDCVRDFFNSAEKPPKKEDWKCGDCSRAEDYSY